MAAEITQNFRDIESEWWSFALFEDGYTELFRDIEQSIWIILTTPKGSDPHRPDFAMNIFSILDRPVTIAIPYLIREAAKAIDRWEPRIALEEVYVEELELNRAYIVIEWRLVDVPLQLQQQQRFVVPVAQLLEQIRGLSA